MALVRYVITRKVEIYDTEIPRKVELTEITRKVEKNTHLGIQNSRGICDGRDYKKNWMYDTEITRKVEKNVHLRIKNSYSTCDGRDLKKSRIYDTEIRRKFWEQCASAYK